MKVGVYGSIEKKHLIGFPADLYGAIKRAARDDKMSIAQWLRSVAEYELKRRAVAKERARAG
jgi:hypothetical protein